MIKMTLKRKIRMGQEDVLLSLQTLVLLKDGT